MVRIDADRPRQSESGRAHGAPQGQLVAAALSGFVIAASVLAPPALAAEPKQTARYDDWVVYVRDAGRDRVCYALSDAVDLAPKNVEHGRVTVMVATWRSGAAKEQPSVRVGYELKPDAPTNVRVGSSRYTMFVDGSDAFLQDDEDEGRLVRAMKRGFELRVETFSARGTATSYEFSLRGVTRALDAVAKACA